MLESTAQALLRQISITCGVTITETVKFQPKAGCEIWILTAAKDKKRWVTAHENRYEAACELANMVGYALQDR